MKVMIISGIVCAVIMLIYYIKSAHPVKNALKGMLAGGIMLVLVSFFGYKINIEMPLSFFNTSVSLILGAPGVALLVAGKILLI